MNIWLAASLMIGGAYLSGSLPFGYLAGKLKGVDIRQHGSGNIGATNVFRVLGKGVGIPVFILDMLKGFAPTLCAKWWLGSLSAGTGIAATVAVICAAAAVLGHNYTPWLGFKGGKGVATSAGSLLGLAPVAVAVALLTWAVVFFTSRYAALASIVAAIVLPITLVVGMAMEHTWNFVLLGVVGVLAVSIVLRHRANISRMLAGTENRFEPRKRKSPE